MWNNQNSFFQELLDDMETTTITIRSAYTFEDYEKPDKQRTLAEVVIDSTGIVAGAIDKIYESIGVIQGDGFIMIDDPEAVAGAAAINNVAQGASALANLYSAIIHFGDVNSWHGRARGAFYLGSAATDVVGIISNMERFSDTFERFGDNFGRNLSFAGGGFKIATNIVNIFDEDKSTSAAVANIASGGFKIASNALKKKSPALAVVFSGLSFTFSLAAGLFADGNYFGGIVVIVLGSFTSIFLGLKIKALLKIAFKFIMKLVTKMLLKFLSPKLISPFTAVIALGIMIGIGVALDLALRGLFSLVPFAKGGFPTTNQPFIAREAGPELVGTIGNSTAVVNNNQIVESVSKGVHNAFMAALNSNNSNKPRIARLYLDGRLMSVASA